jgi:hypothetical protein
LRRELLGPSEPTEVLPSSEFPTTRYIAGRLAPARDGDDDTDNVINAAEDDQMEAGGSGEEDGAEDQNPPLIIGFQPSSFGISFLLDERVRSLAVKVDWGDYKRERNETTNTTIWRRHPRAAAVAGLPVSRSGVIPRIALSPSAENPPGVVVSGVDDPEVTLDGVVHEFSGYRAVSLFLVNRRTRGELGDRAKDERWVFQPRLEVTAPDGSACFVARDTLGGEHEHEVDADGEAASQALLFRHTREFASGHGVSVGWDRPIADGRRTTAIYTEFLPTFEVPLLVAPSQYTGAAILDMKALADAASPAACVAFLEPMVATYERWIEARAVEASNPDVAGNPRLRDSARVHLDRLRICAARMRGGLHLLETNQHVFDAFQFANRTMGIQRSHALWAASNRNRGGVEGDPSVFDVPEQRSWRPFQMGFILLNLRGIAEPGCDERRTVDLLWFPTGGGKTEAYLGLAAFTLALRRLRGDREGMQAGAGVSVLMRYTLRLLTIQQFQRAATLVCACELERRAAPDRWGREPFRIGVWVGRNTTPNTFAEARQALEDLRSGRRPSTGSPVQLVACPWCGAALVGERGVPIARTYLADTMAQRTRISCASDGCAFSLSASGGEGLPVVVVDDEIYRTCPALVVATVDKFARMPFKGETQALFGRRDRFSPAYGHLTPAHGDSIGGRRVRDAASAPPLLPPELVIQDELHLISGPLGTMVGLYEAAIDVLSSMRTTTSSRTPAKVIASTATIRRAAQQVRQLYARHLEIFPPSGLTARDAFFARELPIDPAQDGTAGRLFMGVNAPGSSSKTLLVRVYAVLLAACEREIATTAAADPFGTLVGYFNSLRALGGAKRLVEDDVRIRLKYLASQRGLPRRSITDPEELTSRIDSWQIPGLLKKLDATFPRGTTDWPVDVLLATNMISVGVDIDRLGLMVVTGQPKSTAEYIQATSRVGRKHPGLVVTMYNWLGARDLSHYERFPSYHAALYRNVEAISVTPFSSRALDRGLRGVFAAIQRLAVPSMSREPDAAHFDRSLSSSREIIDFIVARARELVGEAEAERVQQRLESYSDKWTHLAEELLRYSWLDDAQRPPNNSRVLLRTAGTNNEGTWNVPGSLREVEPTAAFYLDEEAD